MPFAIAKKVGMTRVFDSEGKVFAATKLALLDLKVSQVLTEEKNGYNGVQVEFVPAPDKKNAKAKYSEFATEDAKSYKAGDNVKFDLNSGDIIEVVGTGKGKGFAGVIKRHGFSRGPMGHGSNHHRAPGSIGGGYPQRVVAGRKMPGHLGARQVMQKNLEIFDIDTNSGEILIKGSIPGPKGSKIKISVIKKAETQESTN
ncbi:MAG: 50S ribosomal protein L3 [Patescibacteria group bacterium]|jgi:large subunit ribosomal protein L3